MLNSGKKILVLSENKILNETKNGRSLMFMSGRFINVDSVYTICRLDFWNGSEGVVFMLVFILSFLLIISKPEYERP